MEPIHIIYSTFGDKGEARVMADSLLQEKLIACANISSPIQSLYHWDGALQEAEEYVLIAKTTLARVEAAIEHINTRHSYECPCVLSWACDGGAPAFAQWIGDEVA